MAYIQRLLVILFFCIPSISFAVTTTFFYNGVEKPSAQAVCEAYFVRWADGAGSSLKQTIVMSPDNNNNGVINCKFDYPPFGWTDRVETGGGYTLSGACNSPNVFGTDGICNPPPANCTDGQPDGPQNAAAETPVTPQVGCHNGCEVLWNPDGAPYIGCSEGSGIGFCSYYQSGGYKQTGSTCSGSDVTPAPDKPKPVNPNPCPVCDCLSAGKSWGTVNGTTVCVTAGSAGSNPVKFPSGTTTTTPSGGGSSTTINNNNNTSLTISSSSSGSSSGGSSSNPASSATVTATKSDGSTVTQPMSQFCQENPTAAICKTSENGTFSGSCSGGFSCDGDDAVKCAIALEEHKRNCQLFDNQTTLSTLGNALASGVDPNASIDPTTHKTTTSLSSSLNEDSHFSGELTDQSVAFGQFGSINLPFSKLNSILSAMGFIVLAFAYIAAVKIVGVN